MVGSVTQHSGLQEYHDAFFERFRGLAPDEILEAEFREAVKKSQFQRARYDGDFQGTEVGMVLFYTDLLMKLWAIDHLGSAPRAIREFPNPLTLNPTAIHFEEFQRLSGTRLWLGLKQSALQDDPSANALYLSRVATRLFAVPHDFMDNKDAKEAEPHVFHRVFIDWWNRHYAEVARYEPQYEQLNEIMKWSTIIAWLQTKGQGVSLEAFGEVKPQTDLWFPDWARLHHELTFHKWGKLRFLKKGYGGSSTEALKIQHSDYFEAFGNPTWKFSGGVSLGGKTEIQKLPPLAEDLTIAARRGGVQATETEAGLWKLSFRSGNSIEIKASNSAMATSMVTPGEAVRFRGFAGELQASKFERTLVRGVGGATLQGRNGNAVLGELQVMRTSNGLKAGWKARDLDTAYALAKDLSLATNPELALLGHPDVAGAVKSTIGEYFVQLRGSKQWIHLSKKSQLSEEVAEGFLGRASGGPTAPIVDFGLVDPAQVQARLDSLHYFAIRSNGSASDGISIVEAARPPPNAKKISFQVGDQPVEAFSDGDRIFLDWQSLPLDKRANIGKLFEAPRNGIVAAQPLPMAEHFAAHSFSRIANRIAEDPASFRRMLNESLDTQLRQNIELWKNGRLSELQERIAIEEGYLGNLPELRLQKALAQLEHGKLDAAARTLDLSKGQPPKRVGGFIEEIEARLADPRFSVEQRANYRALVDYAKFSSRIRPGTRIGAEAENGQIHLRYETDQIKMAPYPISDERALPQVSIYVEDSRGLNTTDWSPSNAPSRLKDWVQSGRVDVQIIQDVDLAIFTPSMLVETKSGTTYRLANSNVMSHISTASRARCQGDSSSIEESGDPCMALLVRQTPQAEGKSLKDGT